MKIWRILFLSIIFLIPKGIHADLTKRSPACQELKEKGLLGVIEEPLRNEISVTCPEIASPIIVPADIAQMQGTVRSLESHLMKDRIFEALKEEAISDQILNQFKAWEYLGYGENQEWIERENHACVSPDRYPKAHRLMTELIRARNSRYRGLSPEAFKKRKEAEWIEYREMLITYSKFIVTLENEIETLNEKMQEIKRESEEQRSRRISPELLDILYQKMTEEISPLIDQRNVLQLQAYELYDEYPILKTPFSGNLGKGGSVIKEIDKTQEGKSLSSHLDYLDILIPAVRDVKAEAYIRNAVKHLFENVEANLSAFCNFKYSEKNLNMFLSLDGLREKTLGRLKDDEKELACKMIASLEEPEGWGKTALYVGGLVIACGAGWTAAGPLSCLSYAGILGMVIGGYETAQSIRSAIQKKRESKNLKRFFLSSISGRGVVGAEGLAKISKEYEDAVWDAWLNGILTAADVGLVTKLVTRGVLSARAALAGLKAGGEKLSKKALQEAFRMGREIFRATGEPGAIKGLLRLFHEDVPATEILGFVSKLNNFSPQMRGAILRTVEKGYFSRLRRLPCL